MGGIKGPPPGLWGTIKDYGGSFHRYLSDLPAIGPFVGLWVSKEDPKWNGGSKNIFRSETEEYGRGVLWGLFTRGI